MTRKGKASKRQSKKLHQKWYDDILEEKRYPNMTKREFHFMYILWPDSLEKY
jgi:hypothetical protein